MAKVSLSQAAKDTGVSLPTLSRWRKSGKITAEKKGQGYLIDTSEYDRIKDIVKDSPNMKAGLKGSALKIATHNETPSENNELKIEVKVLRERMQDMESRLGEKDIIIDDLRNDRDDWKNQAQKLLLQKPQEHAQSVNENLYGVVNKNNDNASRNQNFAIIGAFIFMLVAICLLSLNYWPQDNIAKIAAIAPAAGISE